MFINVIKNLNYFVGIIEIKLLQSIYITQLFLNKIAPLYNLIPNPSNYLNELTQVKF